MRKEKNYTIDMVNGPLLKNIFIFSVPLMFTNFLQMLFNAADTIVVGKFAGQQALAAVGATGSIIFLLTAVFNGLGMGANVVIAKLMGSQEKEKVSQAVHTSLCIALFGGVFLAIAGQFFSRFMLNVMSTPQDIIGLSELYMRIYWIGMIFALIYNFSSAVLRSKGDTKRPLYFLTVSGILNVVLNLFFVIVLKLSVAGVALATMISQAVAAFLVLFVLMREKDETRFEFRKLRMNWGLALDIVKIGIPAGIQGMMFSISNVVIQSSINSFDSSVIVAGNSAAANVENFVYIGMMAFTQATITFTSQNVGAKNYQAIRKIVKVTLFLVIVSSTVLGVAVYLAGPLVLSLYTNDPEVIDVGMTRLLYVATMLVLNGVLDVFVSSLRGMGYSTMPTILMVIGICGVRLLWLWTVFPAHRTLETIYLCFPISWIITSVIMAILWHIAERKMVASASQ